jgi:uncharacterized protein
MISFNIYGHKNILSLHQNSLEFTKDKDLTLNGDCIVGVNSDFKLNEIKSLIKEYDTIKIRIISDDLIEEIMCNVNKNFNSDHEIVVRRSNFISDRTLGINADKSSFEINRKIINKLKDSSNIVKVEISGLE